MEETTAPIEDEHGNRLCLWCGGPIVQPETGRKRDYCKRSHREYAYRERTTVRRIGDALGLRSGGQETT
ncbi:hypothetical protein JHN61_25375 [Streptomyces sp. MBT67]|jgi:hypothetical protein|uniref:hypothetical protein n=1 Tax=unclassified Streptomyces TaxID=2593676 RepID=UPI00190B4AF3|nr:MULTISPECIES: hypothetical protein [unclassified Streptomyces]MBK3539493.1 hypothetical protein [Streptomyces sp. MBT67]MBK3646848.1 hypothetical protein [Streptomyces sp. MBT33]